MSPIASPAPTGRRHCRVTVTTPGTPVPDGDGGYTQDGTTLDPWWVDITPATARDLETLQAGTSTTAASHIVRGRYRPDITSATQLHWKGRVLNVIAAPANPDEADRELIVLCAEVVP